MRVARPFQGRVAGLKAPPYINLENAPHLRAADGNLLCDVQCRRMAPLIVMFASWAIARLIGIAGWSEADSWSGALRFALAVMFIFTAWSHFHPRTRAALIRMVPANLPAPAILVTVTGVLEFVGAIGLLLPLVLKKRVIHLTATRKDRFDKRRRGDWSANESMSLPPARTACMTCFTMPACDRLRSIFLSAFRFMAHSSPQRRCNQ